MTGGSLFPALTVCRKKSDNLFFGNTDWGFQNKKHYL